MIRRFVRDGCERCGTMISVRNSCKLGRWPVAVHVKGIGKAHLCALIFASPYLSICLGVCLGVATGKVYV